MEAVVNKVESYDVKKYLITSIKSTYTSLEHLVSLGKECLIAYLHTGDIAWLFIEFPDDEGCEWHRLRTSEVDDIEVITEDNKDTIVITTQNTVYTLKEI